MLENKKEQKARNQKTATVAGKKIKFRNDHLIVRLKKEDKSKDDEKATIDEQIAVFKKKCVDIGNKIPTSEIKQQSQKSRRIVYAVNNDMDLVKMAKKISKMDEVEYAEVDVIDEAQLVIPGDSRYSEQWSHDMVNSERAWDVTVGDDNSKILIGIIDSGISMDTNGNLDHPDLNSTKYIMGTDFVDGGSPRDLNSHGTHVAGIAAAESNNCTGIAGMDWKSQVYICRTLDSAGNGTSSGFADAVEEIVDYAIANNLKAVINYSAGGGDNLTKRNACQYAHDNGMILCAAAGNDNGGPVISPASHSVNFDGVIAVGSTDDNDNVSGFSNVGPEITVVAPGSDILSTTPTYSVSPAVSVNYDSFNGTSMATPLVTGLLAMMWSRKPSLSNTQIRQCLVDTAIPLGAGNFNNNWGNGRVDAYEAVSCITIRKFCLIPPFTTFTHFTDFTLGPVTSFTKFTAFTPIPEFTKPVPGPINGVTPFIRFKNRILTPEEVSIDNFDELASIREELKDIGVQYVHELATEDVNDLADKFNDSDKAKRAIIAGQTILEKI